MLDLSEREAQKGQMGAGREKQKWKKKTEQTLLLPQFRKKNLAT